MESFEINSSQIDLNISLLIPLKMYPWKACLKKKIGKHNISIQSVRIDQKQDKCVVHFLSSGISLLLSTILFFSFYNAPSYFHEFIQLGRASDDGERKKNEDQNCCNHKEE